MRFLVALMVLLVCGCSTVVGPPVIYDVPNLSVVDGTIYRGGQPTAEGWEVIRKLGVKTVIKLDYPAEVKLPLSDDPGSAIPDCKMPPMSDVPPSSNSGLTILHCEMPPKELLDALEKPKLADQEKITQAAEDLASLADQKSPVYVHCLHGQDRTGIVIAEYRVLHDHLTPADACHEMLTHGFHPVLRDLHEAWEKFAKEHGSGKICEDQWW